MNGRLRHNPVAWEPVAAGMCFAVALISLALGFVFTTRWLLDDHLHPLLHTAGLILLIVGIPIVILGGHFMDLQEKSNCSTTISQSSRP